MIRRRNFAGTMLKSLPGLVHARDCRKVCAYLVNSRYYPQLAQQMNNDEHSLEDGWQPLLHTDKWLACYPSLCYQRQGFSDIEKKRLITLTTTSISYP